MEETKMKKTLTRNEMLKLADRILMKELLNNVSVKEMNELIDLVNASLGEKEGEQDFKAYSVFLNSAVEYGSTSAENMLKELVVEEKNNKSTEVAVENNKDTAKAE